ncbi:ring-cleaving dioxygenase [Paenibacillus sp. BK720]|uniref:VOC family protein n=1 Tax=Paenibacillus sp. BK720 TaxID=2587092 RepID=UPI001420D7EF|nr:ring-cleaving dioxygenase [Paenibacillus sp. BK720]NIK70644.1 catechol-2,3-dioxygenase [Paenibacillus sp. BK720]
MIIQRLELYTHKVPEQKSFYTGLLGMPLIEEAEDSFTVLAGHTRLTFKQANESYVYHFAFNIEENKLGSAVRFVRERTQPLSDGQEVIFRFEAWNAHACYFYDAAGNIVEFIARHNLASQAEGPFSIEDVTGVSELGMPVADVPTAVRYCREELGLEPWRGNGADFQPVGDEHGLFIVASLDRSWFPTQTQAEAAPFTITIAGSLDRRSVIPGYPYEIILSSSAE